jgi:hypothetical protein
MEEPNDVERDSTSTCDAGDRGPTVHVISTTIEATGEALIAAGALARGLSGRVAIFVCKRLSDYGSAGEGQKRAERELRRLAGSCVPSASVFSCVCDRPVDVAQMFLPPGFVVIGGVARRWWPTAEQRLARALAKLGCHVTFVHVPAASFVSPLIAASRSHSWQASKEI